MNLYAQMDDIEGRVSNRFREFSLPDLAKFVVDLKKAQDDISEFKMAPTSGFIDLKIVKSDEDDEILDLLGIQLNKVGPIKDEENKKSDKERTKIR